MEIEDLPNPAMIHGDLITGLDNPREFSGRTVCTAIRHTHGDINELFCQQSEGAMIASR